MKMTIDLRSALLGLIAGALLVLTLGAATNPGETARYQLATGDGLVFLADTQTGEVWAIRGANLRKDTSEADFRKAKR